MDRPGPDYIEVNEITDIYSFLKSMDWRRDKWLFGVVAFHILVTILSFVSRRRSSCQIILFFCLLFLVYFSEYLNEIAASNWQKFSKQQYFDSNGLFISIIFSCPILINCIFLLARFLYQSYDLMTQVKTAQLRQQLKRNQAIKQNSSNKKVD